MNESSSNTRRRIIRVESPGCACGYVGHMTADELKQHAAHGNMDLSCPACGLVHLSEEEIEDLEKLKVVHSKRYREILRQTGVED